MRLRTVFAVDHQSLFLLAIDNCRRVNDEFGCREDSWHLHHWAVEYAKAHGLSLPAGGDAFGIYYPPDEDEVEELKSQGLWDEEASC